MENDFLDRLWSSQDRGLTISNPNEIIVQAKKQRQRQYIGIIVMIVTVMILVFYTIYFLPDQWNNFALGLVFMISSLLFRIILEFNSIYRKESRLISMDTKSYRTYLNKHYKSRSIINFIITPLCIGVYMYGFYMLLPYFKKHLSEAFYTYILISGIISLLVIIAIIVKTIARERRFLQQLNDR